MAPDIGLIRETARRHRSRFSAIGEEVTTISLRPGRLIPMSIIQVIRRNPLARALKKSHEELSPAKP